MKASLERKLKQLQQILRDIGSCAIAYSGGMDSTFLIKVAYDVLGDHALAVTAASSIYPQKELLDAKRFAKAIGIPHIILQSKDINTPRFSQNTPDRCYYCKKELFHKIQQVAKKRNLTAIMDGSNADDVSDFRPGAKAKQELGIRSPLQEVGLTKQDIRELSVSMKLKSAEKPPFACLASRFPYGTKITKERLRQVESAENYLFSLGLKQCRVRYHDHIARIEVGVDELPLVLRNARKITKGFKTLGFTYITLDLEGYRTGSLNEVLKL